MLFMLLSLALASWAFIDYLAITMAQDNATIYAIRSVISFVVIQNTLFYFFAISFPDKKLTQIPYRKIFLVYSLLVLGLTQSPFLFESVTIKHGTANPNPGPVIIFFVIHALLAIIPGLRSLFVKYRRSSGQPKRQLRVILFASTILWLLVPITNFAITLSAKTTIYVKLAPFYTLAFGALIAYSIVAQKLFDIRSAVARSVAYLLIIGTMTFAYGVALFGIIDVLFQGPSDEFLRQALSVGLMMPLALSFQHIKQFFDRITNQLFYRDSYDIQDVLDKLGSVVVTEIELHLVLNSTRKVLSEALKTSFIEFVLMRDDQLNFEAARPAAQIKHPNGVMQVLREQHQDLLIADELVTNTQFHDQFSHNRIALSLRLKTQRQVVGFILFGDKLNGDIYNAQDKQLLMIVANELALAVQNALRFDEIENFNLTLQHKIHEATHKLRRANDKLKALDESKDDFISMASHQLRTPLTTIKGYTSMVLDGDAGKLTATQKKLLGQALFSSQRMVYLIADLLNVSRLRTGKFVIDATPVNLAEVVQQELEQLQETAAAHSVTLEYDQPADFPELLLDETKTRQVIMNFVDNAIYYTPAGGHIEVQLLNKSATVELRVKDNGIGVPRSERPHLFTKFYRAGNARKARPDGTGLGLFMAKKVIIAQSGALIFDSQEGKGSTFGFTLSKAMLAASKPTPNRIPKS
jgi:signal transduction histidine kinase